VITQEEFVIFGVLLNLPYMFILFSANCTQSESTDKTTCRHTSMYSQFKSKFLHHKPHILHMLLGSHWQCCSTSSVSYPLTPGRSLPRFDFVLNFWNFALQFAVHANMYTTTRDNCGSRPSDRQRGWERESPGHSCRMLWHAAIHIDLLRLAYESGLD